MDQPFRLPGFKELELGDREVITDFLRRFPPEISELTFTNLFMWNHKNRFSWRVAAEVLYLMAAPIEGTLPYLFPPKGPKLDFREVKRLFQAMAQAGHPGRMERVPAAVAKALAPELPELVITPDRDNFDYVYSREALATLAGRRYSRKRNHIKRFTGSHDWAYLPFTPELVQQCLELQEYWCNLKHCEEDPGLRLEHRSIAIALRHADRLSFAGACIAVAGKIQAFSLGESLNPDTAVIHVEKANPELEGLYPTLTHEYVKNAWPDVAWINREQDLGEPGLRQAKESFFPDHLIEKYRVELPA
ncbi:MAG: hypothetical protein A2V67_05590 [Deltaproteobacteria bacterium RBG_13_61_14]|nr:MAG: hypothetical protein A2V67_05590 [Deltaproteobacteria bacterium RBG_13_61_14]